MPPTIRHIIDQFVKSDGTAPESGILRFYPTPALRFTDAPAGPTVGMSRREITLDGAGKIAGDTGLPLVANDSPGLVDPATVWVVEFHLDQMSADAPRVAWFTLSVSDPDPVRLATILRLDLAPTPAAQYVLLSVFNAFRATAWPDEVISCTADGRTLRPVATPITVDLAGAVVSGSGTWGFRRGAASADPSTYSSVSGVVTLAAGDALEVTVTGTTPGAVSAVALPRIA